MAEEPLREIIDAMRTRIQAELDTQIQALSARHQEAIARARQDAEVEAESRWSSKVDAVQSEWSARLESEVSAAREEAETRLAAEAVRVRTESEERHQEAIARGRQDAEAEAESRWSSKVDAVQSEWSARLESEVSAAREEAEKRLASEAVRVRTESEERHEEAIARARQDAEAEAESRWSSKVDAVQSEWSARLESEVSAAREEAEKRLAAERQRAAAELDSDRRRAEQELQQTLAALAAEQQRAAAELDAGRRRAEQELQQTLAALASEREQLEQELRGARGQQSATVEPSSILAATRAISDARSLSETLGHLVRAAAAHATRAAVYVVSGTRLEEWPVAGIPPLAHGPFDLDNEGLLRGAVHAGSCVSAVDGDPDRSAPAFTLLPPGRSAVAVPLIVGGQAVAVLYADEGVAGTEQWSHGSAEAVELLARHAAACLAHLTAVRSLQVLQGGNGHEADIAPAARDDDRSARRYARLLISEIKLYNEGAVRVGCQKRDLLQRLKAEIDRARRLYEERVPATVEARQSYFQHELVHTLAGGDPAALGS